MFSAYALNTSFKQETAEKWKFTIFAEVEVLSFDDIDTSNNDDSVCLVAYIG